MRAAPLEPGNQANKPKTERGCTVVTFTTPLTRGLPQCGQFTVNKMRKVGKTFTWEKYVVFGVVNKPRDATLIFMKTPTFH